MFNSCRLNFPFTPLQCIVIDVFDNLFLHQERITAMEELLENVGDRMAMLVQKPSTRVQACQLLAKTKVKVTTKHQGVG